MSGLAQGFRVLRWLAAVLVSTVAVTGMARLVTPTTGGPHGEPPGVRQQLEYLRQAIDGGAAERAQGLFPEGYFFLHALYGLAWVELGQRAEDRSEALREARWALSRVDTPAGRAPFSPGLSPPYGVFYVGWTTWLRGGVLSLQPADRRDPGEVARFARDARALGTAFDASASPYLPAYPGQAWPVDSTVAVAALRLHDALLPPRFGDSIGRWLGLVRERLDPATGLMPHRAAVDTGEPLEVARATSQSVIHRFLPEIDPAFAREQYLRFRDRFVVTPLGLGPSVREYPSGVEGAGDVDSGPLLLGVSLSATVVTVGAAQVHGDARLAGALANYGEFVGVPTNTLRTKRYAFGAMPIGDAFLAWAKTARPWVAPVPPAPEPSVASWWPVPLLTLLAMLALAPWLPAIRRRGRRRSVALEVAVETAAAR